MNTNWEKRFEERFYSSEGGDEPWLDNGYYSAPDEKLGDEIKDFITTEKESSRKEGLEEGKEMLAAMKKKWREWDDSHTPAREKDKLDGYNAALTQALQKIQELIDR